MSPHPDIEGQAYDSAGATRPAVPPLPAGLATSARGLSVRESLFRAAQQLDAAAEAYEPGTRWQLQARRAVRSSIVAVERRLDATVGADGLEGEALRDEPRLIPAIDRLETDLARLLIQLWEVGQETATGEMQEAPGRSLVKRLRSLAGAVRAVGNEEFSLEHEFFNSPGVMD